MQYAITLVPQCQKPMVVAMHKAGIATKCCDDCLWVNDACPLDTEPAIPALYASMDAAYDEGVVLHA